MDVSIMAASGMAWSSTVPLSMVEGENADFVDNIWWCVYGSITVFGRKVVDEARLSYVECWQIDSDPTLLCPHRFAQALTIASPPSNGMKKSCQLVGAAL